MKLERFEHLDETAALNLLNDFRKSEESRIASALSKSETAATPFSSDSLGPFMTWVACQLQTTTVPPNENVPAWIRETPTYEKGLFKFDEPSRSLIVTAAFYLGETFVRSFDGLHWGLGNVETALCNMPVVTGFRYDQELPPLLVLENIFRRIISSPERSGDIDRMVNKWRSDVPRAPGVT